MILIKVAWRIYPLHVCIHAYTMEQAQEKCVWCTLENNTSKKYDEQLNVLIFFWNPHKRMRHGMRVNRVRERATERLMWQFHLIIEQHYILRFHISRKFHRRRKTRKTFIRLCFIGDIPLTAYTDTSIITSNIATPSH